jgi:hypothetical protein
MTSTVDSLPPPVFLAKIPRGSGGSAPGLSPASGRRPAAADETSAPTPSAPARGWSRDTTRPAPRGRQP